MAKLGDYENVILNAYASGNLKRTKLTSAKREKLKQIAKNTLVKSKRINIQVSPKDLQDLKLLAFENGVPYQVLMSSILHQFLNGKFLGSSSRKRKRLPKKN